MSEEDVSSSCPSGVARLLMHKHRGHTARACFFLSFLFYCTQNTSRNKNIFTDYPADCDINHRCYGTGWNTLGEHVKHKPALRSAGEVSSAEFTALWGWFVKCHKQNWLLCIRQQRSAAEASHWGRKRRKRRGRRCSVHCYLQTNRLQNSVQLWQSDAVWVQFQFNHSFWWVDVGRKC